MTTLANQGRLRGKISYLWRLVATGFSFLLFGCGGIAITLIITLFFYLLPLKERQKSSIARKVISLSFRIYINILDLLGVVSYEFRGKQYIPQTGCIVIANHPSLLDVVFLISKIGQTDCIVKGSLRRNWLTQYPLHAANYVCNDSKNLIQDSIDSIDSGNPLILFPEGTRTTPNSPLKFQRGAANIALSAKTPILPVTIQCHPATLLKTERWYHIPSTQPHYVIEFLPPLDISQVIDSTAPQSKAARILTRHLEHYFTKKLGATPCP